MFRTLLRAALASVLLLTSLGGSSDDHVVVVVNARNPTSELAATEVRNLFTGNVAFWHGTVPVTVVVRPPDSPVAARFVAGVLDTTPQRFEASWQARQLAGKGVAPRVAASASDVVSLVASTPGALGYMLASEAWDGIPAGVKILEIH